MTDEGMGSIWVGSTATPVPDVVTRSTPGARDEVAGIHLLRTFEGLEPSARILAAISQGRASGVTLFRGPNVRDPGQVRAMCALLQSARPAGAPPLIIGFDQEGGQLQTVGEGATAWPGNLALGAAGSDGLAEQVGRAIGTEVAAMGGTLVYAPVCDVLSRSSATPLGTRCFGDDPDRAAELAAAVVRGIQQAGVATTLKHFPGHGSAVGDPHSQLPVVREDRAGLRLRSLPPFQAGIAAGAKAVMPGHLAVPALTDGAEVAATYSSAILGGLLRGELGFEGAIVSDALDMVGGRTEGGLGGAALAALEAGVDLLLLNHRPEVEEAALEAILSFVGIGRLERSMLEASRARILDLRRALRRIVQPPLPVVGCYEHRELARRVADASITLLRDPGRTLPLRLRREDRVAVVAPPLIDLTPAETSSYLRLELAAVLREEGLAADEVAATLDPTDDEIAAILAATDEHRVVVACTWDAVSFPGQVELVSALAARASRSRSSAGYGGSFEQTGSSRLVAVALRSPYDAALFPPRTTSACTYGVQPPQIEALARALLGVIPFSGRLPVQLEPA
jgi:beta-N-acetylhexosaminidase